MSIIMFTPHEMSKHLAKQVRSRRLALNFSQKTLSERSGVSYGTLKKFEVSGRISLESLLKLALILGSLDEFKSLFIEVSETSLDQFIKKSSRKRGRS